MKKAFLLPLYYILISSLLPFSVVTFSPKGQPEEGTETATIDVLNVQSGVTEKMDEDDYLTHVLAAEMPASFEVEALKAQAVAARTYARYKVKNGAHESGVCTDSTHCQAYLTEDEMHQKWGADYDTYYAKLSGAVRATTGQYLSYDEEPAMTVFHSMGGGRTENAADVWGQSVPYLVSVESSGEEEAANFRSEVTVSFEEFKNKILSKYPNAQIATPADVSQPTLSEGGHVKSIIIGSVSVSGTDIRTLFNLRSTMFQISFTETEVKFSVTGYGHGVGMSQYGANAMAKAGRGYEEILSHYYTGTTLENAE